MDTYFGRKLVVEFELEGDKREQYSDFVSTHKKQRFTNLSIHANISRCEGQHTMEMEVHGLSKELINVLTMIQNAGKLDIGYGDYRLVTVRLYCVEPSAKGEVGIFNVEDIKDVGKKVTPMNEEVPLRMMFEGNITRAVADFNNAPDVVLNLSVNDKFKNQTKAITPKTFKGKWEATDIIRYIFQQTDDGYPVFIGELKNNILEDYLLIGSFQDAIDAVTTASGLSYVPDGKNYTFFKRGEKNPDRTAYPVNESTGLIGYPIMMDDGVELRLLYGQELKLRDFVLLTTTEQEFLNGYYTVVASNIAVSSEIPQTEWVQILRCAWTSYEPEGKKADNSPSGKATEGQQIVPPENTIRT